MVGRLLRSKLFCADVSRKFSTHHFFIRVFYIQRLILPGCSGSWNFDRLNMCLVGGLIKYW